MGFVLPDLATENQLLTRARTGDDAAISLIYSQYFSPVYRYVRGHVDDKSEAEDITAEVFVTLLDRIGGWNGPRRSLRGWLFKVARNKVYQHYGKSKQASISLEDWVLTPAGDEDLEIQFMRSLSIERTQQALKMLAPDQREVVLLRFGETLSLQETAEVMGKSTGAIKSLQFRAINTLRAILSEMRLPDYG